MESPEVRVNIAEEESGRLKEYLGSLAEEDWSKPTACHRWTVSDMVAHLAWVAEVYINRINQSLHGEAVPADGSPLRDQSQPRLSRIPMPRPRFPGGTPWKVEC